MAYQQSDFRHLHVYQVAEQFGDEIWGLVTAWTSFEKQTLGRQLVRAVDSIAANIAEGAGRGSRRDNRRFALIARGSLYETKHWLRRARQRRLLSEEQIDHFIRLLSDLSPGLNAYIRALGTGGTAQSVREGDTRYEVALDLNDQPLTSNL